MHCVVPAVSLDSRTAEHPCGFSLCISRSEENTQDGISDSNGIYDHILDVEETTRSKKLEIRDLVETNVQFVKDHECNDRGF